MFSVTAISKGLFPVSHIQLMSRCAGAGREHSQTDSQAGQWEYSVPYTSCSVYEWGWPGGRRLFRELESSLGQELDFFFFSGWESVVKR